MTEKVYRTAQGKTVDMGALQLQNEKIRAVGNMNVNARGDLVDSGNQIIDQKNRQAQRQYARQSNVQKTRPQSGTNEAKKTQFSAPTEEDDVFGPMDMTPENTDSAQITDLKTVDTTVISEDPRGGLAAAIARSRSVKQELEKTPRQRALEQPLKKI
jgi:hypothetical protein